MGNFDVERRVLLGCIVDLVESQAGQPITEANEWRNNAQALSKKLFGHFVAVDVLSGKLTVVLQNDESIELFDHGSLKVIVRAALETYLVFFYIYCSGNDGVGQFRHATWQLGGLTDRQKLYTKMPAHREKLELERLEITRLQEQIAAAPDFQEYTVGQQSKLLVGEWKIGNSWSNLAKTAGFHEVYFRNIYRYLCGYSHSSYASTLQVAQAQHLEEQMLLANSILGVAVVIMSHFCFSYSSAFPSAMPVLQKDLEAKRTAAIWRFGREDMAHLYDS